MLETEPAVQQSVQLRSVQGSRHTRHGRGCSVWRRPPRPLVARSSMSPRHQLDPRRQNPSCRRTYEYGDEVPPFFQASFTGDRKGSRCNHRAPVPLPLRWGLGLAGEEKAGRGCLTPNATPPGRREERAGGGGRGHAGGQALKLAARGKAMQPASAAGRVVVAVGFTFTPRLGLGWVGWSLAQEKEHTGGAASSVVSLAALPCRLVSADHRIYVSLPGWLLAAFRSPDVKRNHRARAFSCCHVFWIGAAVTCMIKPYGFKVFSF